MVNGLGQTTLEHLRLQSSLQEIFDLECKHVIKTHATLIEHPDADESTDESVTLEQTFGVLVLEFEQLTSSTTDF